MVAGKWTITALAVLGTLMLLPAPTAAVAAGGPSVNAGEPTNLTVTSVTFNGVVNPNGLDTHTIQFEYGATPAYGSTLAAAPSDAGSGNQDVEVVANATGLSPSTLYYYRLAATDSNGTVRSVAGIFRTPVLPPAVGNQQTSSSSITQFTATLNGAVNPEGVPTAYHFVYGRTTAYGAIAPIPDLFLPIDGTTHAVSQDITGLTAGTTYHFALVAISPGGTTVGADQTFTTPTIPAPIVGTGAAGAISVGAATLSGTVDPRQWSTTYHFEYGTTTSYGANWPTIDVSLGALTGAQGIAIYVQNLLPGTLYHYRLVATDGGGTSYGSDQMLTTPTYPASVIQETPKLTGSEVGGVKKAGSKKPVSKVKHRKKAKAPVKRGHKRKK